MKMTMTVMIWNTVDDSMKKGEITFKDGSFYNDKGEKIIRQTERVYHTSDRKVFYSTEYSEEPEISE